MPGKSTASHRTNSIGKGQKAISNRQCAMGNALSTVVFLPIVYCQLPISSRAWFGQCGTHGFKLRIDYCLQNFISDILKLHRNCLYRGCVCINRHFKYLYARYSRSFLLFAQFLYKTPRLTILFRQYISLKRIVEYSFGNR